MPSKKVLSDHRMVRAATGLILILGLLLSYFVPPDQLPFSECGFKNISGMPCPSCGLTHSFYASLHFHFREAFFAHFLGPVFVAVVFVLALYLVGTATWGFGKAHLENRKVVRRSIIVLLSAWFIAWIVRLLLGY